MDLHCPGVHSLKEKRRIILGVRDKLRQKFNISIIESAYQDAWQKIQLAVVMAANTKNLIEQSFRQIEAFIADNYPVQVIAVQEDFL